MAIYNFSSPDLFIDKLTAMVNQGGYVEGHIVESSGRRTPGIIEEILPQSGSFYIYFLSNDGRFSNGNRGQLRKNTRGYAYSHSIDIRSNTSMSFDGEFTPILTVGENAKYIAIDQNGKSGTFASEEEIADHISKNPNVKLKFYGVTKELKPEIKVSFGD